MYKYKITLEYDGTQYSGWQMQRNARSIQETLRVAAQKFLGGNPDIQGAGRTDAGVHALGQVAHLETSQKVPSRKLLEGLNDELPASINILKVEGAAADFHARHDAVARIYLYLISRRRTAFGKRYVWWVKDRIDVRKMAPIVEVFRGFHDFASFADKRMDKKHSTLVKLDAVELHQCADLLLFRIVGSHFLWKMIRRMVGILVEAGRGNLSRQDVELMLCQLSEEPARYTAPPSGLFLEQVLYQDDAPGPMRVPVFPSITGLL